jgi:hypothetical protein
VFLVIAALGVAVAAWKVAGAVGAWWNAGPNYALAPTASCLREHGYSVAPIRRGTGDWNYPGIWIARRGDYLMSAYFTPSAEAAGKALARMSVSIGPRRNVATNLEASFGQTEQALACLRSH